MVNEGIVLGHKISERGIEVDKAKVDAIGKMPCPKDIKGIRSFLGHASFYKRFIKDFSKISRCRCQNRQISGRGSRTMRLRRMVIGGGGHDVYPGSGPLDGGNTLLPA